MKEETATLLKVLVALSLILLGQIFAKLLGKAAEGKIPHDLVVPLVGLGVIKSMGQVLPLALLLGLMLTFGRMYQESEMIAIQAAGVGPGRIFRPVLFVTFPAIVLLAVVTLYASPWSVRMAQHLIVTGQHRADISDVTQGRFIEPKQSGWVIFVENFSRREEILKNIFVFTPKGPKEIVETARTARQFVDPETGQQMLELNDGYRYVGQPGRRDYEIVSFKKHVMRVPEVGDLGGVSARDGTPTQILLSSSNRSDQAELQWRLSLPIVALVMGLMALPLSYTEPRRGRFAKVIVAVVVYLVYVNLVLFSVSLVETGRLPVAVGVWWVHGLMMAGVLWLMNRQYRWWSFR